MLRWQTVSYLYFFIFYLLMFVMFCLGTFVFMLIPVSCLLICWFRIAVFFCIFFVMLSIMMILFVRYLMNMKENLKLRNQKHQIKVQWDCGTTAKLFTGSAFNSEPIIVVYVLFLQQNLIFTEEDKVNKCQFLFFFQVLIYAQHGTLYVLEWFME
jgi:hypothetical protein